MSVLTGTNTPSGVTAEVLTSRSYMSTNVQEVDERTWDVASYVASDPSDTSKALFLLEDPFLVSDGDLVKCLNEPIQDRFLMLDDTTFVDGQAINRTGVSVDTIIYRTLYNGFNTNQKLISITYSASVGVSLTSPSVGDTVLRKSETDIQLLIAAEHDSPIFNVDILLTYPSGTYTVTVTGTRRQSGVPFIAFCNWRETIRVVEEYWTDVFMAEDASESRAAIREVPIRSIDYSSIFNMRLQTRQAWDLLQALAKDRSYMPLLSDFSVVTAYSTGSTISCDTRYRNYKVGQFICIAHIDYKGSLEYHFNQPNTLYVIEEIASFTDSSVTIVGTLQEPVNKGDAVFPAIYSEVATKQNSIDMFSEVVGNMGISLNEVYGDTALAIANESYTPTIVNGHAYFDFDINWKDSPSIEVLKQATIDKSGRYQIAVYPNDYNQAAFKITTSFNSKADYWPFKGFMGYVKGRYNTFWVKLPLDVLSVGSHQTTTEIEVSTSILSDNMYSLQGIYLENASGDYDFQKVDSITDYTGNYLIKYKGTTSVSQVTIVKWAFIMRMTSDAYTEIWYTPEVVEIPLSVEEVTAAYV